VRFGSDIHKESLITPVVKVRGGDCGCWYVPTHFFPVYISVKAFTKWSCFYTPVGPFLGILLLCFHIRGHTKSAFLPVSSQSHQSYNDEKYQYQLLAMLQLEYIAITKI